MPSHKNPSIHPALLFVFILALSASVFHPDPLDNVMNRVDLAYALVYGRTLAIDPYADNTIDEASYQGHAYYSEAIGSVPVAAGVVAAVRPLARGRAPQPHAPLALYLMTLLLASIPAALLTVFIYQYAAGFVEDERARLAAALGFGLGTIAFPYGTLYYNALAATLLHAAALALIERVRKHANPSPARLMAIGFVLCYGVITQFDTVILAAALCVYLAAGMPRKRNIPWIAIGALPPAALMLAYNAACFGSPFSFGLFHLASSKEWAPLIGYGMLGVTWPHMDRLWTLVFEPTRGLLWCSPFLIFAAPGIARMLRSPGQRARALLFGGIAVTYVLLNSSFPYFRGGAAPGPRHLLPCLVFLAFPVAYWFQGASRLWRGVCAGLIGASAAGMIAITLVCPHVPSEIASPLWTVAVPLLVAHPVHSVTTITPGSLLGFKGALLAAPFAAICFVFAVWIFRKQKGKPNLPALLAGLAAAVVFLAAGSFLSDARTPDAYAFRARLQWSFGNKLAAVDEYRGLLSARPLAPKAVRCDAHEAIALYQEHESAASAALRHFEAAHALCPNRIDPALHVANIYIGRFNAGTDPAAINKAVRILEQVARSHPDYAPGLKTLAAIYLKQGRTERAVAMAQRILTLDAGDGFAQKILKQARFRATP